MSANFRAGFVGVLGLPNAGKSSLINTLIGEKIAIVSQRPQTTRRRVHGVLTTSAVQYIFVDAPGYVGADKRGLNRFLGEEFQDVLRQADALLVVLSPDEGRLEDIKRCVDLAVASRKPALFVINKVDLQMTERMRELKSLLPKPMAALDVSALWPQQQLAAILHKPLAFMLPITAAPLYDSELYTLERTRDMSAEIIRERAFVSLKQELPYGLAVRMLIFDEQDPEITRITAEILVAKTNHRGMVVGVGGVMIKKIGTEAREQIEALLDKKVFLDLHVTCKPQWMKRPEILKELGYVCAHT